MKLSKLIVWFFMIGSIFLMLIVSIIQKDIFFIIFNCICLLFECMLFLNDLIPQLPDASVYLSNLPTEETIKELLESIDKERIKK